MVVGAADDQAALVPDNLGTDSQSACQQAIGHGVGGGPTVPDIGGIAIEQGPIFAPVGPVVVAYEAFGGRGQVHAGTNAPSGVVVHAIGGVCNH